MKLKKLSIVIGCFLSALAAMPGFAQTAQPVELIGTVQLWKTVVEAGQEKQVLVEPKVVVPGDRLVFNTAYRNTGPSIVSNFVVTNPLPSGVMLDTAKDTPSEVSVDGGAHWGALTTLTVPDGKGGQRPAQASDVTHVRWTLPSLKPGDSGTLSYNAIVR